MLSFLSSLFVSLPPFLVSFAVCALYYSRTSHDSPFMSVAAIASSLIVFAIVYRITRYLWAKIILLNIGEDKND